MTSKILLIEDDVVLSQTLARRLSQKGYVCDMVACSGELNAKADIASFDVFLIDLRLGNDSGLQLITPIRKSCPQAKIIVMTGFASIATAVNAIKLGADDYLPKPLDFSLLLKTIEGKGEREQALSQEVMSPERIEWEHIQKVLSDNKGNVSATARELGMYRRTLQRKLAKKPTM